MKNKLKVVKVKAIRVKRKGALKLRRARHHVLLLPVMSGLALVVLALGVFFTLRVTGTSSLLHPTSTVSVEITYDKQTKLVPTTASTVGGLLKKLDIKLYNGDTVEPSKDTGIYGENFRVNVYRGRPVVLVDGAKKIYAVSSATTPRSIAGQVGLKVYPEDELEVEPIGNFMQNYALGKVISIKKSTPVNVNLYGEFTGMRTTAHTVGDLLTEKKISLPSGSSVFPKTSTRIKPKMQVFVTSKGQKIEVHQEKIAMPVKIVHDKSLSFGVSAVRQRGSPGERLVTYQINKKSGNKTKLQEFTSRKPVTQIVARGSAINIPSDHKSVMAAAGISKNDYAFVDYIVSRESGWCPTKVQGHHGHCPSYVPDIPNYGGYGMCQSTPPSKMASAGKDWQSSAVTQLRWCSSYASRYGSWQGAYDFWIKNHWW